MSYYNTGRGVILGTICLILTANAYEVGRTPGHFSVGKQGESSYEIPIVIPPGVAGLQPELSLIYDSNAGNGHLGVGWSIAGLSAITRCPTTLAQDGVSGVVNFLSDDRYCLDGQRLMLIAGNYGGHNSRYRTEIESFQDIYAYDDDSDGEIDKFLVRDKGGLTRYYGYTGQSQIEAQGRSVISAWMLNKVQDKFGNYYTVGYVEYTGAAQRGEYFVYSIDYFNARAQIMGRIQFNYDVSRTDSYFAYSYGASMVARLSRLSSIDVYGHDPDGALALAWQYELTYQYNIASGHSQLIQVRQCDAMALRCLAPTNMTYIHGENGFDAADFATLNAYVSDQFMDVDGDGRVDHVYETNYLWTVRFSGSSDVAHVTTIDSHSQAHQAQYTRVLDYNGDGKQDLLVANISSGRWEILESTGSGLVLRDTGVEHFDAYQHQPLVMDLDGDALPEIIFRHQGWLKFYRNEGGTFSGLVDSHLRINIQQVLTPLEYDGDGRPDIVVNLDGCSANGPPVVHDPPGGPGSPYHPRGGSAPPGTAHCSETAGILTWNATHSTLVQLPMSGMTDTTAIGGTDNHNQLLDFNADGLTDLAVSPLTDNEPWRFYVNTGAGWELSWSGHNGINRDKATVFDYDGDGRQELWQPQGNTWYRLRPSVTQSNISFTPIATLPFNGQSAFFVDWTGDGLGDLVSIESGSYHIRAHRGSKRGLLKSIEDGLGNEVQIAYVAMSDIAAAIVYGGAQGSPAFPDRHFRSAMYLVRSVAADSGLLSASGSDLKVISNYTYYGAKLNQHGRGFLGFSAIEAHNVNTEIITYNRHSQSFPYIGMVIQAEQWTPDVVIDEIDWQEIEDQFEPCNPGAGPCIQPRSAANAGAASPATTIWQQRNTVIPGEKISETINTPDSVAYDTGQAGQRYFPYVASTTERQFKFRSSETIRRTVTASTVDEYGNATATTVTVDDGAGGDVHRVSTSNEYQNWSDARWCLGRLMTTVATHERSDHGSGGDLGATRHSAFLYDQSTCQLVREQIEPGNSQWRLQKDYDHDDLGNRISVSVSGPSLQTRTSSTVYDDYGQYPAQELNALDHAVSSSWDYVSGQRLSTTDVNGLVSSIEYDSLGRMTRENTPRSTVWSEFSSDWCAQVACDNSNAVYRSTTKQSAIATDDHVLEIIEYDQIGRQVLRKRRGFDGRFIYTSMHHDSAGRVYATSSPHYDNEIVCWEFKVHDNLSRPVADYRPAEVQDCLNHGGGIPAPTDQVSVAGAYGNKTTFEYDGLETRATDSQGHVQIRRVNVMDRLISVQQYDDAGQLIETAYDYDPLGNPVWVRDADGNTAQMTYNLRGFKVSMDDPDLGLWQYNYNSVGELVWQRDANQQITVFSYDLLGRLTSRFAPEGLTRWYFDLSSLDDADDFHGASIGRLTRVTGPDGYEQRLRYRGDYGELSQKAERLDANWYCNDFGYDNQGRIDVVIAPAQGYNDSCADANRLQLATSFNEYGFAYLVRELRNQSYQHALWRAVTMDARGNITTEQTHDDSISSTRYFDPATSALQTITTGSNGVIQNSGYLWDAAANLVARSDFNRGWTEHFSYDALNQLKEVRLIQTSDDPGQISAINQYDRIGNLLCKDTTGISRESCSGGFRDYEYGTGNTAAQNDAGPHAVSSVVSGNTTRSYQYDNNGNLTTVSDDATTRTMQWYSFNKVGLIHSKHYSAEFHYRPGGHSRWKQITTQGDAVSTRYYSGGVYERNVQSDVPDEHIFYVRAGGRVVARISRFGDSSSVNTEVYFHRDHIGSLVAVSNADGEVLDRLSYDAWGKRRYAVSWLTPPANTYIQVLHSQRGFSGHEHIDQLGLINMNGRIYDPEIGRFMSADPYVQHPDSTQGLNRYSFVQNNPVSFVDPSGFFLRGLLARVAGKLVTAITGQPWLGILIQGYLSSGNDLKAMAISLVLGNGYAQTAYTNYQYYRAGMSARKSGGRFINGLLRAVSHRALGQISSIGQNYLINTGERILETLKQSASSNTAGTDREATGTSNGAESDAFDNAVKLSVQASFNVRIRKWLEMGIQKDGSFFARASQKSISIRLDESGNLVFSAGKLSTEFKVDDFDVLARHVRDSLGVELSVFGAKISVLDSGKIQWSAFVQGPGLLAKLGVRGSVGLTGTFDPSDVIKNSGLGQAGYQYRQGTTQHVDQCLDSDFTMEGC